MALMVILVNGAETTTVSINGNNIGLNSSGAGSHGNTTNGISINGSAVTTVNIGVVTATDIGYGKNNIGNNGGDGINIGTTEGPVAHLRISQLLIMILDLILQVLFRM